jgi:hypothetical protein
LSITAGLVLVFVSLSSGLQFSKICIPVYTSFLATLFLLIKVSPWLLLRYSLISSSTCAGRFFVKRMVAAAEKQTGHLQGHDSVNN